MSLHLRDCGIYVISGEEYVAIKEQDGSYSLTRYAAMMASPEPSYFIRDGILYTIEWQSIGPVDRLLVDTALDYDVPWWR